MITEFLQDALFAAIAAIGFAAISDPPRKAYLYCATIAAAGHSVRFLLMHADESSFPHYFYLFAHNGMTCLFILLGMTVGATVPIFLLKRISFRATRDAAHHE